MTRYLVRLHWPEAPERKRRVAAHRLLIAHAPATLHGTGMQMLDSGDVDALLEVLSGNACELILLPAPSPGDCPDLYRKTGIRYADEMAVQLEIAAEKIRRGERVTTRFLNPVYRELDILSNLLDNDLVDRWRRLLDSLAVKQHARHREKSASYLEKFARNVRKMA